MRQTITFASIALIAGMMAFWATTGTVATSPKETSFAHSINVMQMMRDAKNLPEQQFDAY